MCKLKWKPGAMIYPVPAVMVSCGSNEEEYNIITIAWTGIICSDPAMCYISVRPERHSYEIIKRNKSFVINLTTKRLAYATDWCGVKSGRDFDKFKEMKLTPIKAASVNSPMIEESPVNIECIVKEIKPLGTHDMFISEVISINVSEKLVDKKTGVFKLAKSSPIAYCHGKYYQLGEFVGKFGYSVQKKKNK